MSELEAAVEGAEGLRAEQGRRAEGLTAECAALHEQLVQTRAERDRERRGARVADAQSQQAIETHLAYCTAFTAVHCGWKRH